MSEKLLFTEDEWNAVVPRVVAAMTEYLRPYRAAVYEHKKDENGKEYGEGWGSGSYLRLGDRVFIMTNQHIACAREQRHILGYQFDGQDEIRRVVGNHAEFPYPLDLAILSVDMKAWADAANRSKAIEVEQIALGHDPVPTEILTFTGFAGQNVRFHFDTLFAAGTCYTAREIDLPQDDRFSSRFHFGVDYRPDRASTVIGKKGLPLPPGLSGSTVWNTGFVAAKMAGVPWKPELAKVTGVLWGWPPDNPAFVIATRAEFVRSFLLDAPKAIAVTESNLTRNGSPTPSAPPHTPTEDDERRF